MGYLYGMEVKYIQGMEINKVIYGFELEDLQNANEWMTLICDVLYENHDAVDIAKARIENFDTEDTVSVQIIEWSAAYQDYEADKAFHLIQR